MTNGVKKVPELRFPEFDGEWEEKKLGDLASVTKLAGFEFTKHIEYSDFGEIPAIRGLNVKHGGFVFNDVKYIDNSDLSKLSRSKLDGGNIVYTYVGTIGDAAIVPENKLWYLAPNVAKIVTRSIKSKFLLQILLDPNFKKKEVLSWITTSSQPALSMSNIRKFKMNIPKSSIEQEKIGEFFSKLDRQIELEEQKLAKLEEQKKGYMQKIFTQELKFKNSQLENIKWSYKTLEELNSFFTDGNYGESYPKSEDMSDKNDGVAFLRGSNLKKGRITLENANYISKKKHSELTTGHLFLDDIVIAVRGSLGAVGYVNENMVGNNINSQLAIIRTSNSLLYGKYLLYYLMSNQGKKELLSRVTGTALKQLPIKQIKQIKVPVPKLHEQHKIANFLSELDNLIDNQTEKIELLKERKNGFLQKMFI